MLVLKSLLAEIDRVPVLIFDEIDIGISGRIAGEVGRSLRRLAKSHQVICITHLPQIASMANHHYLVEKGGDDSETRTMIRKLSGDERTEQIARLFGGVLYLAGGIIMACNVYQTIQGRTRQEQAYGQPAAVPAE